MNERGKVTSMGMAAGCLAIAVLSTSTGCRSTREHTAGQDDFVLFPICAITRETQTYDHGGLEQLEENGSVLLLINWAKECRWDEDGQLVGREENFVFFPIMATTYEENEGSIHKTGSILLLVNYDEDIQKCPDDLMAED